jgi:hypothetical protein
MTHLSNAATMMNTPEHSRIPTMIFLFGGITIVDISRSALSYVLIDLDPQMNENRNRNVDEKHIGALALSALLG